MLSRTTKEADPAARKKQAAELYNSWRAAIESAMKNAPNTLFVCAAGNEDVDASFMQDVPAGLRLPNLIAVGAVNQAGDETDFTSHGSTVAVDADGITWRVLFQVGALSRDPARRWPPQTWRTLPPSCSRSILR